MGKGSIYLDYLSQPCRALALMCKLAKIDVNVKEISLLAGEHKSEEYKKINPSSKVPAYIDGDGWTLTESVAIARYLCTTNKIPDNWYPQDPKARARVDEFLSWQHAGIRANGVKVFLTVTFYKKDGVVDMDALKERKADLEACLDQMENHFLKERNFVAGDKISIADLFGLCELWQPVCAGYKATKNRPLLEAWVQRVKAAINPHFDELNKSIVAIGKQHTFDFDSV